MTTLNPRPGSIQDVENSACDLVLPHLDLTEEELLQQLRENFQELVRWVHWARLNKCFGVGGGELTFTYPAGLTVSTSVKASLPQGTVVKGAVAHLKVPSGQGTVQLSILYNGSSVGSISIPAGQSFGQVTFANPVTTGDRASSLWQISITAAGSGGSGLVVHLTV